MPTVFPGEQARFVRRWSRVFLVAAAWNLLGGLPGLFDPAGMFAREFGRDLADPVMVAIYRGAWGTALLYGLGFLIVATDPLRHWGIVVLGVAGKALFALNLALMYRNGWTSDFALIAICGDLLFVAVFLLYLMRLRARNAMAGAAKGPA